MGCLETILSHVDSGAGQQIVSQCAISYLTHDCVNAFSTAHHSLELKHESDTCRAYGKKSLKTKFQFNRPDDYLKAYLLPCHCKIPTYVSN